MIPAILYSIRHEMELVVAVVGLVSHKSDGGQISLR